MHFFNGKNPIRDACCFFRLSIENIAHLSTYSQIFDSYEKYQAHLFSEGEVQWEAKGVLKTMVEYTKRKLSSIDDENTLSKLREDLGCTDDEIQMYLNHLKEAEASEPRR
jgi:CRISPR/Cas system CMR-associated protein Cmr5 small subunit